jgi:hypothetical protein
MTKFIIQICTVADANIFVGFWKQFYDESYEGKYDEVINKQSWEANDIHRLFEWKNNMKDKLAKSKETFVKKIVENLQTANNLRTNYNHDLFIKTFGKLGPIWGITFLHALQPGEFPIYDQHAHRAYTCLSTGVLVTMPKRHKIYTVYFDQYVPFFKQFSQAANNFQPKEVDNALWAFGKFLSRYPSLIVSDIHL